MANEIFDMLEKFAGYGFNRSHSAAYAWISYQTAYLKANYPVEFMAAVMSNEVANTDKISIFVAECERMGITILPPDVNKSGAEVRAGGSERRRRRGAKARASKPSQSESAGEEASCASRICQPRHATASTPATIHVGAIRYGLAAIKNVGEAAMEAAVAERERRRAIQVARGFLRARRLEED